MQFISLRVKAASNALDDPVAWCVCLYVYLPACAPQKRLNGSRSCSEWGLLVAQRRTGSLSQGTFY